MSGANAGYNAPTDFRIGQSLPAEVPEEYRAAFQQIFSAIQQLILTLISNCGIGPRLTSQWTQLAGNPATLLFGNLGRFYVTATEDIAFGAAISLTDVAGTAEVRNANATNNTKPCHGFCSTSGGILTGATGEVQLLAGSAKIAGLVPGGTYYLSTTNGILSASPAVAAGNIQQFVGIAVDSTTLLYNVSYWIQH